MTRKPLPLKTKLASALLALGDIPYKHAKEMTEDQLISLYQFDHGMLHESEHPQRDMYWNITPRLIKVHRDKTKLDAAIIAKGRRVRKKLPVKGSGFEDGGFAFIHVGDEKHRAAEVRRKLRSRGFDKRYRRHLDGTITKR